MRIALIGCSYHWHAYASILEKIPNAKLEAVACGSAEEDLKSFATAPGIHDGVRRFADPRKLLDEAKPDLVQISTEFAPMAGLIGAALERKIPVLAEKPIAMHREELANLWAVFDKNKTPLFAMQGMLASPAFRAAEAAVRAGQIGEAFASNHQKSYRWNARPPSWRERKTFPGLTPWVGIHALAWMTRCLGDVFTEVSGTEGGALHPETPACATQAGFTFKQVNGGFANLSIDYLRPRAAPTHGDERLRIAGSKGVLEALSVEERCTLIEEQAAPRNLELKPVEDPNVVFAQSLLGAGTPPVSVKECFRVTELGLCAQEAAESGRAVKLTPSPYAL